MLIFRNQNERECGPGALVRFKSAAAKSNEVYCLVIPQKVMPDCPLSRLQRVTLYTPGGHSKVMQREWVHDVSVDWSRGTTLVQLTQSGVNWLLAHGATCRSVAPAKKKMRATYIESVTNKEYELKETCASIKQVGNKIEIEMSKNENEKLTGQGLLLAKDGNVLAVSRWGTHYSLEEISKEFLEDRGSRIRCFYMKLQKIYRP